MNILQRHQGPTRVEHYSDRGQVETQNYTQQPALILPSYDSMPSINMEPRPVYKNVAPVYMVPAPQQPLNYRRGGHVPQGVDYLGDIQRSRTGDITCSDGRGGFITVGNNSQVGAMTPCK